MERRVEPVRLALDHRLRRRRLELFVAHHDDDATVVQTPPAGPAGHLDVLARGQVAELAAVELADVCEDDRLGGHVEADGERLGGEEDLDEALLEEDLDDLFEDGEQAAVVDADAALEQGQDVGDLGQRAVLVRQARDGVGEDGLDRVALVVRVELELGHLQRQSLALALGKGEDDDGVVRLEHDHLDDLVDVGRALLAAFFRLALLVPARVRVRRVLARRGGEGAHCLLEVVLAEDALFVDDEVDAVAAGGEEVVLERGRAEVGVDDVAGLLVRLADPLGKLHRVWDRRREEDVADLVREQDDRLLPHDPSLWASRQLPRSVGGRRTGGPLSRM